MTTPTLRQVMNLHELKRTVSIIICDEDFLPMEKYHCKFHLWEDDERCKFSDALEIHVLEIQKAVDLQERYSKRREARDAYTRRVVAIGDENTRLHFAREDGMATILRHMAQTGNTPTQISSSTGLPIGDVLRMLK